MIQIHDLGLRIYRYLDFINITVPWQKLVEGLQMCLLQLSFQIIMVILCIYWMAFSTKEAPVYVSIFKISYSLINVSAINTYVDHCKHWLCNGDDFITLNYFVHSKMQSFLGFFFLHSVNLAEVMSLKYFTLFRTSVDICYDCIAYS